MGRIRAVGGKAKAAGQGRGLGPGRSKERVKPTTRSNHAKSQVPQEGWPTVVVLYSDDVLRVHLVSDNSRALADTVPRDPWDPLDPAESSEANLFINLPDLGIYIF